ncbi:carbon-nitrogen hydrolase family protein [Chenggangzhangella methanolivorans]|uniref:Carbon-nitrogen hydrolase family protein n=1 Tax=Chenggangzhangella methanolivorans TaxID=1437009 RepID=A0A9E6UR47_9HYPH|nr:carbon-nitrogen hydrolase family protein [Chenggangzhangella methanolivorans]QZO01865.1 carbon-nitrogen hydrolase family protein [Chenggangzhangella methanolivorans]
MTERKFVAACVQMRSGKTVSANVDTVVRLAREAKDGGAAYVQTPEMTNVLVRSRDELFDVILPEEVDPALAAFQELARALGIWLHLGSLAIRLEGERAANRAFVIDPDGDVTARYDKIHMFDVDLPNGESWRESQTYRPGEQAVVAELPWGGLGLTICYDVRFPTLHRALAEHGAEVIASPAAFTKQTGEAHWNILLRARAIETGSFVVAAAQGGKHEDGRETFGHSLIVDPWGRVLAEGGEAPGVVLAEIDLDKSPDIRRKIPSLENGRRFGVAPAQSTPTVLRDVASS